MNRRNFFKKLAVATAGFSILPAATTYERVWKAVRQPMWIPNPDYVTAPYEVQFYFAVDPAFKHDFNPLLFKRGDWNSVYKFDSKNGCYQLQA